jgi:hypothetical protein
MIFPLRVELDFKTDSARFASNAILDQLAQLAVKVLKILVHSLGVDLEELVSNSTSRKVRISRPSSELERSMLTADS